MSLRENSNNDLKEQEKNCKNVKYFFEMYKEGFLKKIYKER